VRVRHEDRPIAVFRRLARPLLDVRYRCKGSPHQGRTMLYYSVVFFVLAIIAGVFGFGGIAAGAAGIAKILFVGFLIVAIVSLFAGRKPSADA
jgi:uncharacterized membrane protein YtjA (UPF0391 family)